MTAGNRYCARRNNAVNQIFYLREILKPRTVKHNVKLNFA
jgi:hypothetical protein